jgi:hypothetical protein
MAAAAAAAHSPRLLLLLRRSNVPVRVASLRRCHLRDMIIVMLRTLD